MLASDYTKLKKPIDFEENRVLCQPKLDGIRCIARADGLWTRAGKEIVSCPHIMEALTTYFDENPDDILDGELYNHELKADFNKITSLVRKTKPTKEDIEECAEKVQYHIYDGIIDEPYHEFFSSRFFWIKDELRNAPDCIQTVKTCGVDSIEMLDELYGTYLTDGYEGQMVRYDAMYENKRSKYLMKRKEFITEEFPVVGVEEGKGNWSGHVKIFRVEYAPGKVCGAGVRGDQATLKKLFESDVPDWCTLRYFEPTPDGVPRFPVVIDWGYGKRQD
jgi:DNA ligase-1